MALITLPTKFSFGRVNKWGLDRAGNVLRSRYTGSRQAIVYPYAVWTFDGDLIDYPEPEASAIRAFITALEGVGNTFNLPVPGYNGPSGGYVGNGAVNTAAVVGANTLSVKNLPASTKVLIAGEYFMVNGELKMLTADVNTTAGGIGTFNFEPSLRAAAAVNAVVTLQAPYCTMAADDDDVGIFSISPPVRHSVKIKC